MSEQPETEPSPFDSLHYQDKDRGVLVEMGGYVFDQHSLVVGMQDDEMIFDFILSEPELRRLAAWATAVADAIESPPSEVDMIRHHNTSGKEV